MDETEYAKISLEDIIDQNSISGTGVHNFIVSNNRIHIKDSSFNIENTYFNLKFPHVFEGIAFAICVKGNAKIKINLQEYNVEANSIIALLPDSIGQIIEQDEDLVIEFLSFSSDFIPDIKLMAEINFLEIVPHITYLKLDKEMTEDLLDFHSFIIKQYKYTDRNIMVVKSLIESLMYKLLFILRKYNWIKKESLKILTYNEQMLQQFLKLLFRHYKQERTIKFYASNLNCTPKHLARIIKDASGQTASQWIDEMVITTTKALLKSSGLAVAQISEDLNFANPSFFGTYFKKHTGMTPMQYRQS